jgi:glc operon protein GlcG
MKSNLFIGLLLLSFSALAQKEADKAPAKVSTTALTYGEPISLESAQKILKAGQAFAVANQWTVAIAIVDSGGNLVVLEKMDNTQLGSIDTAIGKAKTANNFKRPTKALEDALANGGVGLRVITLPNAVPIEGGEPIIVNGKVIGAIGVSGMSSAQDAEVARAGLTALK